MIAEHLDTRTLVIVLVATHIGLVSITCIYFWNALTELAKTQTTPKIALFLLGNVWPLTWTCYLAYVFCDHIGWRQRMGRIQMLVDENNRLQKEIDRLREQQKRLDGDVTIVGDGYINLPHQSIDADKLVEMLEWFDQVRNSPTPLPPYTPDVWKAIRELQKRTNKTELQLDGMVACELLQRMFMIEAYLDKGNGSGSWTEHLKSYDWPVVSKNEAPEGASQDVACQERHD